MRIESGFTIAQVAITVAITGVLSAVAVQSYQTYIAKTQAAEIGSLLTTQQVNAITDLKNGRCPSDKLFGKFGNVIGSGTFAMSNGASCQTGCELKYQFNTNGVARELQGKTVTVALLNSGKIASVDAKTTLPDKYLKGVVFDKENIIGDSCTKVTPTEPLSTSGVMPSENEVGMAAPVPLAPSTPGGEASGAEGGAGSETESGNSGGTSGGGASGGGTPGSGETVETMIPYEDQVTLGDAYCYIIGSHAVHMYCVIASLDGKKALGYVHGFAYDQHWTTIYNTTAGRIKYVRDKKEACKNVSHMNCFTVQDLPSRWDVANKRYFDGRKYINLSKYPPGSKMY